MDLQEWELLPDDGFLEINDDADGGKKIFSRKFGTEPVVKMNHFIHPSEADRSKKRVESRLSKQLVPVPIQLEPVIEKAAFTDHDVLLVVKEGIPNSPPPPPIVVPSATLEKIIRVDQDPVSQVSFKKKETEFVDMKMDSPMSNISSRAILPQIDSGMFTFDEGQMLLDCRNNCPQNLEAEKDMAVAASATAAGNRKNNNPESDLRKGEVNLNEEEGNGFNLWKWSFTGIGAICSFGFAAATVWIVILGNQQKNKNQKIGFEIYADEKRMKRVVHHATKLNEAMSAVSGVPLARAHITVGGYYDAF